MKKVWMICTCDEWLKGMGQIDQAISLARTHDMWNYTGATMHFCPWCGKPLKNEYESELQET
jgi:hypothetical protein